MLDSTVPKRKRVLATRPLLHPVGLEILRNEAEVVTLDVTAEGDVLAQLDGVHGIITRGPCRITRRIIEAGRSLEVLSVQGAGYDWIDWQAATERGIPVLSVSGVAPVCVAEHVIAFMFCLAKRMLIADRRLREGDFSQRDRWDATELEGKTLGIVGLGRIGRVLARKASIGLGMRVIAVDPVTAPEAFPSCGAHRIESMNTVLQESDYVSLHVPLLPGTRHLIGTRELARMKPTACLINTARGAVVDTAALVAALQEGRLAGAAVDVFEEEPPPRHHPLFGLPNVVVTPHTAGFTLEAFEPTIRQVAHQVLQVLRGERPAGVVNPEVYSLPSVAHDGGS